MTLSLHIHTDMDTPIFVFLVFFLYCVSGEITSIMKVLRRNKDLQRTFITDFPVPGLNIPRPDELVVNILDGEILVMWKHPVDAPPDILYNVQMAKYTGEWAMVASCTGIRNTYCDLSSLIYDYRAAYKVRVQLVAGDDVSAWSHKKFLPNTSELQPPSFTLWATSSTLTVYIHQKPILKKLFPYGLTYTIYLEDRGNQKNITAYLDDNVEEDQSTKIFSSLRWGREYCVSIKVEGIGALSSSSVSPRECLLLPEQEWFIIAVSSLSIVGMLVIIAIIATILLCYLTHPEKTPTILKSPVSGWRPLSVGEGTMEVVTDKGWFLSSYRTEVKPCVRDPLTQVTVTEDNSEEDRRTSMDSGVGMESNCATNSGGSHPMRQEDSGCGSLGGPESSTSCQTDYPLQDQSPLMRKREDSGVGLGSQLHSSSINLDGSDSESLKTAGGNYRSQSHSTVQINSCDDQGLFKQILPDSVLAEVVTGYRAGPQTCICSAAGQCPWCHKQGHYGTEVTKQYRAMCIDNGLLNKVGITFSSYSKQTQIDTVMVEDLETTFIPLGETFPLLTALSSLPLVEGGQDFNMNNVSLPLCDVQLTTE